LGGSDLGFGNQSGFMAWLIQASSRKKAAAMRRNVEVGINFIDTASIYGKGDAEDFWAGFKTDRVILYFADRNCFR